MLTQLSYILMPNYQVILSYIWILIHCNINIIKIINYEGIIKNVTYLSIFVIIIFTIFILTYFTKIQFMVTYDYHDEFLKIN